MNLYEKIRNQEESLSLVGLGYVTLLGQKDYLEVKIYYERANVYLFQAIQKAFLCRLLKQWRLDFLV